MKKRGTNVPEQPSIPKMPAQPVIMAERAEIMLWGFITLLKDKRDGSRIKGYAIETGNEEYDIEIAQENIALKYERLGYELLECDFDNTRLYTFDALKEFREAKPERKCKSCEFRIIQGGCGIAEDENDEDNEKAAAYYKDGGKGCEYYETTIPVKTRIDENKPDYLSEIMATLEELEEGAE